MNYIVKNTSMQLVAQVLTYEQRNFVTNAILLHTSVLCFFPYRKHSRSLMVIGVRECIFLEMQKIFAQIWSSFSQVTYKQRALTLRLKYTIENKSRFVHA